MWLLLVVFVLLLLLYIIFVKNSYWKNKGVPGPTPLPLVGNLAASLLGQKNVYEIYAAIYRQYEDCPFVGVYRMGQPCLLLRDPELIKNVVIKDFNHFMDNDIIVDKKVDPIFGRNPFVLKGEEWKKSRQFLTPNFATGKVKAMFPIAEHVSKNFVKFLEKQEGSTVDAKDVLSRYSSDVVAICAFGIEGNSFEDSNSRFLNMIRSFDTTDFLQSIKITIAFLLPKLIKLKLLAKSFDDELIALTTETLKYRQEHNIRRSDYFDVISQTPSSSPIDMAGHMATMILDGSETTSVVMGLIIYELAQNSECQAKLRAEINNVISKCGGEFSYEALQNMTYLDACVNEILRLHPPFGVLMKTCVEDYTMASSSGEFRNLSVKLGKGSTILIPLLGLHRDPAHFPSPTKFKPERFLDKTDSQKNIYMPFGNGPRMCLGSRFGLMVVKVAIAQVIKNFELTLDPKTIQPIKYDPVYFTLYPKGGIWFRCKKITPPEGRI